MNIPIKKANAKKQGAMVGQLETVDLDNIKLIHSFYDYDLLSMKYYEYCLDTRYKSVVIH